MNLSNLMRLLFRIAICVDLMRQVLDVWNERQDGVINDKHIIFVTCNGSIRLVYIGKSDF